MCGILLNVELGIVVAAAGRASPPQVAQGCVHWRTGGTGIACGQQSDHLLMAQAYSGWVQALSVGGRKAGSDYARRNFLSQATLEMLQDMRRQFGTMLADISL